MSNQPQQDSPEHKGFTLRNDDTGQEIHLDRLAVTSGKEGIDASGLRAKFNAEVFDPGLGDVAHCRSAITFINGEKGILRYRGYDIQDLVQNSNFLETVCLLRDGELPTAEKLTAFEKEMADYAAVPESIGKIITSFDQDDAPMDILASAVSALAAKSDDQDAHRIIAQMPTLVAMIYRQQQGKNTFIAPDPALSYTENFLRMCFADDNGHYTPNPVLTEAMDKIFILHADHEQNAGTATMRGVRSTQAKTYTSVAAAIGALAGPLHGGANQKVLEMLDQIVDPAQHQTLDLDERIQLFIDKAKDKNDPFRLMGFGHRVYKNRDPRAVVLKSFVDALLDNLNVEDPRLEVAKKLEETALSDPYFADRKLYPNVDFYSGIALAAVGLPARMFTLIFALGRTPGWVAQAEELVKDKLPITRPRQLYIGEDQRSWAPVEQRGVSNDNNGPAAAGPAAPAP